MAMDIQRPVDFVDNVAKDYWITVLQETANGTQCDTGKIISEEPVKRPDVDGWVGMRFTIQRPYAKELWILDVFHDDDDCTYFIHKGDVDV